MHAFRALPGLREQPMGQMAGIRWGKHAPCRGLKGLYFHGLQVDVIARLEAAPQRLTPWHASCAIEARS